MPKAKADLQKHTLNLRQGDYDRMGQLFDGMNSAEAIRSLISKFIDKNWKEGKVPKGLDTEVVDNTDDGPFGRNRT